MIHPLLIVIGILIIVEVVLVVWLWHLSAQDRDLMKDKVVNRLKERIESQQRLLDSGERLIAAQRDLLTTRKDIINIYRAQLGYTSEKEDTQ